MLLRSLDHGSIDLPVKDDKLSGEHPIEMQGKDASDIITTKKLFPKNNKAILNQTSTTPRSIVRLLSAEKGRSCKILFSVPLGLASLSRLARIRPKKLNKVVEEARCFNETPVASIQFLFH